MLTMDVWNRDPFTAIEMSYAADRLGYIPTWLDSIKLFEAKPVTTKQIFIEERGTDAALIQTSPRGAAPRQTGGDERSAQSFKTVRLADASRITADELQDVRAFGSLSEMQSLQLEIARRTLKIKNNFALTKENLRLSCVMGAVVKDADGSTIVDWGTKLNNPVPAPIAFDFSSDAEEAAILTSCTRLRRGIKRSLRAGNASDSVKVMAIAGDNWFDKLTGSKETRDPYKQWQAAADLRESLDFATFRYGSILFNNYRGTDDVTVDGDGKTTAAGTVGVHPDECWFFPVGVPGGPSIFQWALAPAERFAFANTPGQDIYSFVVPDTKRDSYADIELYSYPLPVCTLPSALRKGTIAA